MIVGTDTEGDGPRLRSPKPGEWRSTFRLAEVLQAAVCSDNSSEPEAAGSYDAVSPGFSTRTSTPEGATSRSRSWGDPVSAGNVP